MTRLPPAAYISLVLLVTLAFGVAAAPLETQMRSLRCAGKVVMVGDSAFALHEICGKPDWTEVVGVLEQQFRVIEGEFPLLLEQGARDIRQVERWYYRGRVGRLSRRITVVGGEVTNIEVIGRD